MEVVSAVGGELRADIVLGKDRRAVPRIFAENEIRAFQFFHGAKRDVSQIPDRRGH
jgi:hypothetical protein